MQTSLENKIETFRNEMLSFLINCSYRRGVAADMRLLAAVGIVDALFNSVLNSWKSCTVLPPLHPSQFPHTGL